jgi:asparagine synthase (glutamine-hydrolysing)
MPEALSRMAAQLVHRGPDDGGVWHTAGVGFSFRRLAILDLSQSGHQPMQSASGRYTITFNGEIYNHKAIRAELACHGHRFRGHSDTEVLLAAFEEWGVQASLPRTIGMFAFAVWDANQRVLTLARDRLGKKPLFVASMPGLVLFGSELKALVSDPDFDREVDPDALAAFLRYVYIPAPHCIYRSTIKVPPAHFLEIRDADAPLPAPEPYWDVRVAARAGVTKRKGDSREALDALSALLDDAVRLRLESDVPVGALLSGGIDSSLVVARMQRLSPGTVRTFTIGFDEPEWDESLQADAVARHLGTSHTLLRVSGADALAVVPEIPDIFDEPLADPSQVPTVLVSRLARRQVTVALCGDGGDEVFGGYNRYVSGPPAILRAMSLPGPLRRFSGQALGRFPTAAWDAAARFIPAGRRPRLAGEKIQKLARLLLASSPAGGYRSLVSAIQNPTKLVPASHDIIELEKNILDGFPMLTLVERMMLADQIGYLPDDLLAKADRASMSASLELRSPLLDHRIVEFGWQVPMDAKIRGGKTKWMLRELLARDVPRELFERPKMGFSIPVRAWLAGPLRSWAEDMISTSSLAEIPLLDAASVRSEWQELRAGRGGNGFGMWTILQFVAWWRRWRPSLPARAAQ